MSISILNLNEKELRAIHNSALSVLDKTGLRIDCKDYHGPLEAKGAKVDSASNAVRFPGTLVEETIEQIRQEIAGGYCQNILNGVVSGSTPAPLRVKFGGACIEFLDWENKTLRKPSYQDLVNTLRLGEAIPEVGIAGNPVVCLTDADGKPVDAKMQRIVTAATVAKFSTKCGSTEVWNEKELDLLIEIGTIVRGSFEDYQKQPCFITAKETIDPLIFPEEDGRILLMLAKRGLPCTIIPMPLSGMSSPVTIAANAVMGVAEVLGVMTALKVTVPEAKVAGGVISGTIDMKTTTARFAAPEAILQDLTMAQVFNRLYGQNFGIGTGYIDAKVPGSQSLFEKYAKLLASISIRSFSPAVGIINSGKRFCMEEAIAEIEIARHLERLDRGFEINETTLAEELINRVGIGGNFIAEEHTFEHFRDELFMPELLGGREYPALDEETANEMLQLAIAKKNKILADCKYEIDPDRSKAIDEVVKKAEKVL